MEQIRTRFLEPHSLTHSSSHSSFIFIVFLLLPGHTRSWEQLGEGKAYLQASEPASARAFSGPRFAAHLQLHLQDTHSQISSTIPRNLGTEESDRHPEGSTLNAALDRCSVCPAVQVLESKVLAHEEVTFYEKGTENICNRIM